MISTIIIFPDTPLGDRGKQKPRNLLRGPGYIELAFKLIQNMPRN